MFQRCKRCGMHIGVYTYWVDGQMSAKYLCPMCDQEKVRRLSRFGYIPRKGVMSEQKSKK